MSRIGKLPIPIPAGVEVKVSPTRIEVQGPRGSLAGNLPSRVRVETDNGNLVVRREGDDRKSRALHGLVRALVNNMVVGVTQGFKKNLEINGVGYRAEVQGKSLKLELGFSHPIVYPFPAGIEIKVEKNVISVEGPDKEKVGQTAAEIRALRKPEPYKGKGIRYSGERIRIKVGKKNA